MRKFFLSFLLLFIIVISFAQGVGELLQAKRAFKKGLHYMHMPIPNYEDALSSLLEARILEEKSAEIDYNIALCYLHTTNKKRALEYVEKAYDKISKEDNEINFVLAFCYHLDIKFDEAIELYEKYLTDYNGLENKKVKVSRHIHNLLTGERSLNAPKKMSLENVNAHVQKKIKECKSGKILVANPVDAVIENLGFTINSSYADFGPVISADESVMYFTSRRKKFDNNVADPVDGKFYEDIYVSYNNNGFWSTPILLDPPINTVLHESVLSLSADGQTMFIFKDDKDNIHDGGDVFMSRLNGYEWSKPERMPKGINSNYSERSIAISADEKTLYLVSDRPGGFGGGDIYYATKNDLGLWETPENLGPTINTKYNELGVYFHPNGKTLYFGSKGHNTMGGYDIFKSELKDGKWSDPENLGYPINTPDDDTYFVLNAKGTTAYYSSVKETGRGEKDIYRIKINPKEEENLTVLLGFITDEENGKPLEASIKVIDNGQGKVIAELSSNKKTGKYLVTLPSGKNYGIAVERKGYLFHSENFNIRYSEKYQEIEKDVALVKIEVGAKIVLKNIFFDFNKATLKPEPEVELDRLFNLLQENPSLIVEIAGHTDNKGSKRYNQLLSEARAKSVVTYLVDKGIDAERLSARGYGEERPIAANELPNGKDNPEGRQLNRRTEFEILEH